MLSTSSVYDVNRDCLWDLPSLGRYFEWTLVGETEIVAFTGEGIYSLKMKLRVQPASATVLQHTKTLWDSMLFSPDLSDVTFVCSDGTEIPAHKVVLAAKNSYFKIFSSEFWAEQYPGGRWETSKSANVIKCVLSLIYTGEAQKELSDVQLLELLNTAYEFQLGDDLLRVCQAKCIDSIALVNVKALFLSAMLHDAKFLFDACFEYICKHFHEIMLNEPQFGMDINRQLWEDIVKSAKGRINRKRPRDESE